MSEITKGIGHLLPQIRELIVSARHAAACTVNTLQVVTNYEIGRLIVEHEQAGAERARYGKALLKELSASLTTEFGKGFSQSNLEYMRRFYLVYRNRSQPIGQTLSSQLAKPIKSQTVSGKFQSLPERIQSPDSLSISETLSGKSTLSERFQHLAAQFPLSWSHYVFLTGIKNPDERSFYEIEAASQGWSLREFKRQFGSSLYERLALSCDKGKVRELSQKGHVIEQSQDLLKDPYVLEFLGLDEKAAYSESDLESAIIDKLEHFLLELGKGFLFEGRQKRFTFDEDHFFVDLVFYNRLLRCYVLIDLKIGKLAHQDLGQMQMYVNYFDRYVKTEAENPTVGILLCHRKSDALVELTLPEDAQVYASEYRLYLPSKEELRQKLLDWAKEAGE